MIRNFKDTEPMIPPKAIALLIAMILMSAFFSMPHALAEMDEEDFDTADVVILDDPVALLEELVKDGLFNALEQGKFGDVKRPKNGGKGLDGVVAKGANYSNPFINLMKGRR